MRSVLPLYILGFLFFLSGYSRRTPGDTMVGTYRSTYNVPSNVLEQDPNMIRLQLQLLETRLVLRRDHTFSYRSMFINKAGTWTQDGAEISVRTLKVNLDPMNPRSSWQDSADAEIATPQETYRLSDDETTLERESAFGR